MIYLDYAATTPCAPEVVEAMLPFFTEQFANASSVDHAMGATARRAVEEARGHVAALVGAKEEDVIFTSGSTEANNLVLATSRFVVTSAVEHPSVLEPTVAHETGSFAVLPVTHDGTVAIQALSEALQQNPRALVSIMHTNNETGAQNDVLSLTEVTAEHGGLFHTDITQGLIHANITLRQSAVHGLSLSAHKIYGPKGVGALICKPVLRRELRGRQLGGGHERGLRSGTLNVPGIVGLGTAARIMCSNRHAIQSHIRELRSHFLSTLESRFSGRISINGADAESCSHIISIRLHGVNNRALLRGAGQNVSFALGSACATNKNEPSHVLRAMGLEETACNETIRISFGSPTTAEDAIHAATAISDSANRLLEMVA